MVDRFPVVVKDCVTWGLLSECAKKKKKKKKKKKVIIQVVFGCTYSCL